MHRTLKRQILKYIGSLKKIPKEYKTLFLAISESYKNFDESRLLMERSLEINSKEFDEINAKLKKQIKKRQRKSKDFAKMNSFMVGRELKMMKLKEENRQLRSQLLYFKKLGKHK